jgi:hypothetical protein
MIRNKHAPGLIREEPDFRKKDHASTQGQAMIAIPFIAIRA